MTGDTAEPTRLRAVPTAAAVPSEHSHLVAQLFESAASATTPPGITLTIGPAPARLAPFAFTLLAETEDESHGMSGSGRLVLLHDPTGNPAWQGTWRAIAYLRADVDEHIATDPLLHDVVWSWMTEAWDANHCAAQSASGTVTCNQSRPFGEVIDDTASAEVELRCSWTVPADADGLMDAQAQVHAWLQVLKTATSEHP